MTISETFLKFGVRFPLHLYFRSILNYYNLTVFQVTPNRWANMRGLFVLFVEQKMEPPTPKEFSWFCTLKSCQSYLGFYYFSKQASNDIWAIIKIKETLGTWKNVYFYTPKASVRGRFAEPSKFLIVSFLRSS